VLHNESKHVRKVGLLVQPTTGLAEIHALVIRPSVPLMLKL
jgi:hypothetical protein